jgi:hypothetical protein
MKKLGFAIALVLAAGAARVHAQDPLEEEVSEDPARPPPAGMGVITGRLVDAAGEPLIEAEVKEMKSGKTTLTDLDGFYRLELPPGTYDLRFWYELHQARQVRGVAVQTGAVVKVDERLQPMEGAVDVVAVETEADTSSTEGQLLTRKRAAAVGDSVGRAEIARTPDRNAAEAAKRVVGADIVGDRFVYVRGLGQRYNNALLDGAPLPSPEPDQQTVPLDLFPATMLESITIAKTFTPDVPGDFAGGSVQIETRRIPTKLTFGGSLSIGINSQSTFRDGLTYRGSSMDFLGIDGGARELPSSIPDYRVTRRDKRPDGEFITPEELTAYGRDLNAYMSSQRAMIPPDHGGNLVVGHGFEPYDGGRIGFMGAITYGRSFELRPDMVIRTFSAPGGVLTKRNDLTAEHAVDKVRWGALGGVTWELSPGQRLHLTGFYTRSSDNNVWEVEGFHEEKTAVLHETRLSFISRALAFGQLRGEHDFPDLDGAHLDWNAYLARADRDEPDTRATVYRFDSNFDSYTLVDDSQSGYHFFSGMGETTVGGGLDWTQPLEKGNAPTKVKLGTSMSSRSRSFSSRRFRFVPDGDAAAYSCPIQEWDPACSDQIFVPDKIGSSLILEEATRPDDDYDASLRVLAGYVMVDAALADDLRLVVGPRIESSKHDLTTRDRFLGVETPRTDESDTDILAAAGLTWAVTPQANLRLSATRTVARPQLRELSPTIYNDYFGGRQVQGNPDLEITRIYNGDVRFEWFPTSREVIAVSVFAKHFRDPIEQVILSSSGQGFVGYQNAKGANLAGIEIEARKSFDFVVDELADLSLVGNVTFTHSRVELDDTTESGQQNTSKDRALSNQAPFIVNVALDYDNEDTGTRVRVLYNVSGASIHEVGTQGLPDIYRQPRHVLDASVSQRIVEGFELKATGTNLVNSPVRFTHGSDDDDEAVVNSYTRGVGVSLGASYTY